MYQWKKLNVSPWKQITILCRWPWCVTLYMLGRKPSSANQRSLLVRIVEFQQVKIEFNGIKKFVCFSVQIDQNHYLQPKEPFPGPAEPRDWQEQLANQGISQLLLSWQAFANYNLEHHKCCSGYCVICVLQRILIKNFWRFLSLLYCAAKMT